MATISEIMSGTAGGPPEGEDPYFRPPTLETEYAERAREEVERVYDPETSHLLLIVGSSRGDDVVVYSYNADSHSIDIQWVLVGEYRTKYLEDHDIADEGQPVTRELTEMEEMFYGCDLRKDDEGRVLATMRVTEMYHSEPLRFEIAHDDDADTYFAVWYDGHKPEDGVDGVMLERAYAQFRRGTTPSLDYLHVHGVSMSDGEFVSRKITKDG